MQHSPAWLHGEPLVLHIVSQTPPLQSAEQHSAGAAQGEPPGLQPPPPHMPLVHWFEQHWPGVEHAVPAAPHAAPQVPALQPPEQHSAGAAHGSPLFLHVGAVQRPSSHVPEQHDVPKSQMEPASRHVATHWPLWQLPEQQSPGAEHAPLALQLAPEPDDGPAPPPPPAPKLTVGSLLQPANGAKTKRPRTTEDQARRGVTARRVSAHFKSIEVRGASPGRLVKAENRCAS